MLAGVTVVVAGKDGVPGAGTFEFRVGEDSQHGNMIRAAGKEEALLVYDIGTDNIPAGKGGTFIFRNATTKPCAITSCGAINATFPITFQPSQQRAISIRSDIALDCYPYKHSCGKIEADPKIIVGS